MKTERQTCDDAICRSGEDTAMIKGFENYGLGNSNSFTIYTFNIMISYENLW